MGKVYTTRSFKSGNSVAIRMPAGLGIEPDREWIAEWVDGDLRLHAKEQPRRKIDVSGFAGKAPWLKRCHRNCANSRNGRALSLPARRLREASDALYDRRR